MVIIKIIDVKGFILNFFSYMNIGRKYTIKSISSNIKNLHVEIILSNKSNLKVKSKEKYKRIEPIDA